MNSDYFRKLSETATQSRKTNPAILADKIAKYLAAGNTITSIPRGVSGATLAPMGIKRSKGAQR